MRKKYYKNKNKQQKKDKRFYRKISEFYTGKYDDISREERAVLAQMDSGEREFWHVNHFRNIPSMNNSGEKIAGILAGLAEKPFIFRNQRGGTGYRLETR